MVISVFTMPELIRATAAAYVWARACARVHAPVRASIDGRRSSTSISFSSWHVRGRKSVAHSHLRTELQNLHPAVCDYVFLLDSNYFHIQLYSPLRRRVVARALINKLDVTWLLNV